MLAPWKGLHDVLWMIALYRDELRTIGIEKFSFYGGAIYQTNGSHLRYQQDLILLVAKLGLSEFVFFAGLQSPEKIFSEIDLLIHSSLEREPFGRVIIEAFRAHVPVISTGLGGAGELVHEKITGLKYSPYDQASLYAQIKSCIDDKQLVKSLTQSAASKVSTIEEEIRQKLPGLLRTNG